MGRTVVIEEGELNRLTASARAGPYTGLLVGQTSEQKDFVVFIFPTPSLKEITGGEKLAADGDWWIEEHSKQVSRMLPGGLAVVGLLFCCLTEEFKSQQARTRGLLLKMLTQFQSRGLILHLCSKSRKYKSYAVDSSDSQSSFKPAETKAQTFASGWYKLETSIVLDSNVYTIGTEHKELIEEGVKHTVGGIREAVVTVNSQVCRGSQLLAKICGEAQGIGVGVPAKLYIVKTSPSDPPTAVNSTSVIKIAGHIKGYAYLYPKASCEEAITALKRDLESSMLNRYHAFCVDSQQQEEEDQKPSQEGRHEPASPQGGQLPRRVHVLLSSSPLILTDYCFPDEDEEECKNRIAELLGVASSSITIQPFETFPSPSPPPPPPPLLSQAQTMDSGPSSPSLLLSKAPSPTNGHRVGAAAVIGGLLAVLIAVLLWVVQTQS